MKLKKNAIVGIGALVSLGVVAAGAFFVALPQFDTYNAKQDEISQINTLRITKEAKLKSLEAAKPELESIKESALKYSILMPTDLEISSIGVAVASALTGSARLASFSYGDPVAIADPVAPTITLTAPAVPSAIGAAAGTPAAESSEEGAEVAVPEAGVARQVPLAITVTADSVYDAMNYVSSLGEQTRLIRVDQIALTSSGESASVSLYGYAYINDAPAMLDWLRSLNPESADEETTVEDETPLQGPLEEGLETSDDEFNPLNPINDLNDSLEKMDENQTELPEE